MSDNHHTSDFHDYEPLPEGEEAPPPYVRTMAIVRWVILSGLALFAVIMILSYIGLMPGGNAGAETTLYHCPMHPTYVSNQPGECPICGMTLVPMKSGSKDTTMPMTMPMTDSSRAMTAPAVPQGEAIRYTCPMHPEIISDKPGECPICGMDLVPMKPSEPAGGGDQQHVMNPADSSSVPGLVSVTIDPHRLQLIGVRTGKVERRSLADRLRLVGYVTPDETRLTNLTIRPGGWIQKLFVNQTGQAVKKDQPLLTIYSQDLFQAEQDFLASMKSAARDSDDSLLATTRRELARAARERLRLLGLADEDIAALEQSGTALPEAPLRSPFTGVVLEKNVVEGQYVGSGQNLFTIADLSTVWVLAGIYEQDIAGIAIGQKAKMRITARPGEEIEGTVSFVYPTVSEQTRTLNVRLQFPNPGLRLKPGMFAEVELERGSEPVLAVPSEAVMDGGEMQYAFVVHDGRHFIPHRVAIGRASDDWIEVLSGLQEGDEVVTSANFLIDSESRLKAAVAGMSGAGAHAGHGH